MRTVKISDQAYKEIKAFARANGIFLQFALDQAIYRYLDSQLHQRKSERKTQ